ncbi:metallophosphoesterase family protein [Spirochaeta isovalerica]|uniref:Putative phosphodiesterase n=1 Tax=Spirochaeta isovalerica TaxID=150 RepID=A0A841RCG3_9SPIO|nr:metallophosphoesterase [Spirochaeta isovalerica]MBB6481366.1 putative phosphodiesterase [Spirochaeta isovalerica]
MHIRITLVFIISFFLLTGCDQIALLGGFFYSYSTPDERFIESQTMDYESDPSLIKDLNSEDKKYQFIVFSDIQGQDPELPQLRVVLDEYMVDEDEFILDCGDSSEHGFLEEFEAYKSIMDGKGKPWFQTIGNHDTYHSGWKYYREVLGKTTFSLEIGYRDTPDSGSMFIIALDSANSTIGALQMEWLEETLKKESGHWDHQIVFSHSQFFADPILTVVQFSDPEEIYKLMYLFSKYKVDIMFAGHTHVWNYRTLNGVEYVTTPPLEKPFSEDAFIRVFVDGDKLSWEKVIMEP